jgi:hypothetical protein
MKSQTSHLTSVLAMAATVLMAVAYFTPVWWVSLTAPNYPKDRFPDGIRIEFGFTGVSNGCTTAPKTSRVAKETTQEDLGWRSADGTPEVEPRTADSGGALDCVHEMNTINHYVGMRPIGVGAPVERLLGRYILGMFAVMLIAFALRQARGRPSLLTAGFAGVSAWMVVELFGRGALDAFITTYKEDAARYFNEAERIAVWGENLRMATTAVAAVLMVIMVLVVMGTRRWVWFQLLLGAIPALLPAYFVLAYAAWLGWFGHNMHPWGAFTLKPFMPTVFGDGMVAQFSTHSYPDWGFFPLVLMMVLLLVAVARRRLELLEDQATPPAGAA